MIKALAKGKDGPVIIIGLSRKNTEQLLKYKPIAVNLSELSKGCDDDLHGMLMIMGGETEETMQTELAKYLKMPESE